MHTVHLHSGPVLWWCKSTTDMSLRVLHAVLAEQHDGQHGLLKLQELCEGIASPRSDHVCFLSSDGSV